METWKTYRNVKIVKQTFNTKRYPHWKSPAIAIKMTYSVSNNGSKEKILLDYYMERSLIHRYMSRSFKPKKVPKKYLKQFNNLKKIAAIIPKSRMAIISFYAH